MASYLQLLPYVRSSIAYEQGQNFALSVAVISCLYDFPWGKGFIFFFYFGYCDWLSKMIKLGMTQISAFIISRFLVTF
jgi:hypothetical protein